MDPRGCRVANASCPRVMGGGGRSSHPRAKHPRWDWWCVSVMRFTGIRGLVGPTPPCGGARLGVARECHPLRGGFAFFAFLLFAFLGGGNMTQNSVEMWFDEIPTGAPSGTTPPPGLCVEGGGMGRRRAVHADQPGGRQGRQVAHQRAGVPGPRPPSSLSSVAEGGDLTDRGEGGGEEEDAGPQLPASPAGGPVLKPNTRRPKGTATPPPPGRGTVGAALGRSTCAAWRRRGNTACASARPRDGVRASPPTPSPPPRWTHRRPHAHRVCVRGDHGCIWVRVCEGGGVRMGGCGKVGKERHSLYFGSL